MARVILTPEEKDRYLHRYYVRRKVDDAHGVGHIQKVRQRVAELADATGYRDKELLDVVALLHDIGVSYNRDKHHILGAKMIERDKLLQSRLGKRTLQVLVDAVREHRASTGNPRTLLGKILSDADRTAERNVDGQLARTYMYREAHYPQWSTRKKVKDGALHVLGKYGKGGYGRNAVYLPATKRQIARRVAPLEKLVRENDWKAIQKMTLDEVKRQKAQEKPVSSSNK